MKKYSLITKVSSHHSFFRRKITVAVFIVVFGLLLVYILPQMVRFGTAIFWLPYDTVRLWVLESENSLPVYFRDRHFLDTQIEDLEKELALMRVSDVMLEKLKQENNELRNLLGVTPESRVLARVLARPGQLPYDVLMIDKGEQDGIMLDTPVFVGGDDRILGLVTKVLEKTAHVTLVTTPGFLATAYIYGPNIYTTTEGMGSGVLRVRVPQGIELSENDIVILPAVDSGVFGTIARVETSPTKPERYGYIIADIPLQSLQYVSVAREPVVTRDFIESQEIVVDIANNIFSIDVPLEFLVTPMTSKATSTSEEEINAENDNPITP